MKENAFIQFPRKLLNTEYYTNGDLLKIAVGLLAMARFVPEEKRGVYVGVGQFLTTRTQMTEMFGIPKTSVRRALDKFEKDGLIAIEKLSKTDLLITVNFAPQTPAASTLLKNQIRNKKN